MGLVTGPDGKQYNTDDQSSRADLRKQGYYIDNSGVYAPGAGNRVGDTWSGGNAGQNVKPSSTQLPVINGTPVSPSNGATGPQTPAIMYRGDPSYSQYFGPGTPGYSSTSMGANAMPTPLPAGQDILKQAPMPAAPAADSAQSVQPTTVSPPTGRTLSQPNTALGSLTAGDGQVLANQSVEAQAAFRAMYGPNAEQAFVQQHNAEIGDGSTAGSPTVPTLSLPVTPANDQQSGNGGGGGGQPSSTPARVPGEPEQPATFGGERDMVPLAMPDGKVVQVPREFYNDYLKAGEAQAAAAKQATQFQQGLDQGKLDVERMVAEYNKAYQQALVQGQTADRAQALAIAQMQNELQKQTVALQKQQTENDALFKQQTLDLQRSQQAQTNSLEQEKLAMQRRQLRGRRSLPSVRYK